MDKVELQITANGMNGEGIARENGKVFFVQNAIEGETVLAQITKQNKKFSNAMLEKIITKSENRCPAKCEYYNKCGGCNLQHIKYQKQLQIKRQNVQNLFNKHKLNFQVLPCEKSELEYAYRNKLTLYLNNKNSLCFYKYASNELTEIDNCYLVDEKFNILIKKLNYFFKNNREFAFILKGISIRQIDDIFLINLILTKKINFQKLQNYLKLNKINFSLYYCINAQKNSNLPQYPCVFIGGIEQIYAKEYDIKYPVYPMSFLQVNNNVKKQIYEQILAMVNGYENVLDAYSGAGLLSAVLSKTNKQVYAVEIDQSASLACEQLCKLNNINNVKSICADCGTYLPELLSNVVMDCVVLDPAKAGTTNQVLTAIANSKVKKVIYLSCNPATLTRDLEVLVQYGYKITFAKPFDMFPQTSNVETLIELQYQNNV